MLLWSNIRWEWYGERELKKVPVSHDDNPQWCAAMILHDPLRWLDNPSWWGDPQTMKWIKRWERREDVIEQMTMQLLLDMMWSWMRCNEDDAVDALGAVEVFELMMVCCFRWWFVSDDFERMRWRWWDVAWSRHRLTDSVKDACWRAQVQNVAWWFGWWHGSEQIVTC